MKNFKLIAALMVFWQQQIHGHYTGQLDNFKVLFNRGELCCSSVSADRVSCVGQNSLMAGRIGLHPFQVILPVGQGCCGDVYFCHLAGENDWLCEFVESNDKGETVSTYGRTYCACSFDQCYCGELSAGVRPSPTRRSGRVTTAGTKMTTKENTVKPDAKKTVATVPTVKVTTRMPTEKSTTKKPPKTFPTIKASPKPTTVRPKLSFPTVTASKKGPVVTVPALTTSSSGPVVTTPTVTPSTNGPALTSPDSNDSINGPVVKLPNFVFVTHNPPESRSTGRNTTPATIKSPSKKPGRTGSTVRATTRFHTTKKVTVKLSTNTLKFSPTKGSSSKTSTHKPDRPRPTVRVTTRSHATEKATVKGSTKKPTTKNGERNLVKPSPAKHVLFVQS